ncbi:pili assembly chaperone protein SafB, partial [Salmonella enterica]|nr:pili assembly chaperone protein SafB [Salmonella enterica]EGV9050002.1 pili assembly chaperone protein SafB [Salmonella enterica]EGW0070274.1 pili assembly chaperone protein SafB [Salmonella enterica]
MAPCLRRNTHQVFYFSFTIFDMKTINFVLMA